MFPIRDYTNIINFKQLNTDFKIYSLEFLSHIFCQDLLISLFPDTFRKEMVMENVRIDSIFCHYNPHALAFLYLF